MMRLLVELEANLNGRLVSFNGEPNVTLLYDASYFGHAHLVRYLLQQKGNPDIPVKFQDYREIGGDQGDPWPVTLFAYWLRGFWIRSIS